MITTEKEKPSTTIFYDKIQWVFEEEYLTGGKQHEKWIRGKIEHDLSQILTPILLNNIDKLLKVEIAYQAFYRSGKVKNYAGFKLFVYREQVVPPHDGKESYIHTTYILPLIIHVTSQLK